MLFGKKKGRDKVPRCPNGHLLDPSWDHCPYCEEASSASGEYLVDDGSGRAPRSGRDAAPQAPSSLSPGPQYGAPPAAPPYGAPPGGHPGPPGPLPPPGHGPASGYGSPPRQPYGSPYSPPSQEPPRRPTPEPVRRREPEPVRKPVPEPLRRDFVPGTTAPAGPAGVAPPDDITVINARVPGAPAPIAPPAAAAPPRPSYPPPAAAQPAPPRAPGAPAPRPPIAPAPPPEAAAQGSDATQILASPAGEKSVVAWVVIASGSQRGRDFRLPGGTARIGSAPDCEVRITDDPYFSSHHAELTFGGGHYLLRDLQSTNGSFVNETRIAEHQLHDGDHLRLGLTQFVFKSFSL